ncbi:MAG: 16S rRNA (guanine(527)-N(7))-methyltransferase RsmG [Clostridiales bacterium]|nr:16S rRNA (guanine(527)-N(7))-methyltransferase RsmG [Eubacteriales bacterium]MDH7567050.1 16S rRNA (guanine(527)-N(7))-methyltransferase RsmG [Clostridiales bacterium]
MEEDMELADMLQKGAGFFSANMDDLQLEQFFKYKEILKEWNERINLTAIQQDRDIIIKHFIDSLSVLPYIQNRGEKLIDIGTGAGFPGIPVKILCRDLKVTLLDSLQKRIKFLDEVIKHLDLKGIETLSGRAEDWGRHKDFREKFDVAVARAVASLPVLLEYSLPFVRTGGIFIAMKGSAADEVESSKRALEVLGGEIVRVDEILLPFSDIKRSIIVIRKLRQTPTKFPRKAGKPSKEPMV